MDFQILDLVDLLLWKFTYINDLLLVFDVFSFKI